MSEIAISGGGAGLGCSKVLPGSVGLVLPRVLGVALLDTYRSPLEVAFRCHLRMQFSTWLGSGTLGLRALLSSLRTMLGNRGNFFLGMLDLLVFFTFLGFRLCTKCGLKRRELSDLASFG